MKTELYKAIKAIDVKNLTEDDKDDLLRLFLNTKNGLIRDQIAFIFADVGYEKAVPYIMEKINDKALSHNNGSLLVSLADFDMKDYFIPLVKIICEHEYEPRLVAYGIVEKFAPLISATVRDESVKKLEESRIFLESLPQEDKGENSRLHFIEKTKELLK